MKRYYLFWLVAILLCACSNQHPTLPSDASKVDTLPRLLPDYSDVTVPVNIAPLNFLVDDPDADRAILQITALQFEQNYGGTDNRIIIDEAEWRKLMESNAGGEIRCTLYTHRETGWQRHPDYLIHVSPDTIDRYVSYRLIEPSYVAYENIAIRQRDVTTFEETTILDNSKQHKDHCMNCHSYQNYRTDNMLLHIRGEEGGTLLIQNGKPTFRTDLRRDSMMSNPVYPAWHPTLPFIAFSTNKTGQFFHLIDPDKIEVQDSRSSLVLYDINNDKMIELPSTDEDYETFPTWSPDGNYLYYSYAHYVQQDTTINIDRDMANHYKSLRYNIYRRPFDAKTVTFGDSELVLDLESLMRSANLPRISPDGRYILFACGEYGYFQIWHSHADIWMYDLETQQINKLIEANSQRAESYPTWSSTGRWIYMASRRDDNNYSRIYMAHFGTDGRVGKAFELPQADPFYNRLLLKSYNRPEPMIQSAPQLQ